MQVASVLILTSKTHPVTGVKSFLVSDENTTLRRGSFEACMALVTTRSDKFMGQHPLRPEAVKALKALRKRLVNG